MDDNNDSSKPVTKNQHRSAFHLTPSQAVKLKPSATPFKPSSSQKSEIGNNNNNNNNATANNNDKSNGNTNSNGSSNKSKSRRSKNNKKSPPPSDTTEQQTFDDTIMNTTTGDDDDNANNNNKGKKEQQQKRRKQKQKQKQPKQGNNEGGDTENHDNDNDNDGNNNNNSNSNNKQENKNTATKKNNQKKKKKNNNKKKFPWRRHIPTGTVDPITLENLQTLEYPPFALVADLPYLPVPEWPIIISSAESINNTTNDKKTSKDHNNNKPKKDVVDVDELNRERLAEQWGMHLLPSKEKKTTTTTATTASSPPAEPIPLSERPLNLFDGRALAFYMVSQLQFIDPFTRRDLTRPELVNLDRYLSRYGGGGDSSCGFNNGDDGSNINNNNNNRQRKKNNNNKKENKQIRVTDAYDAKGITLSSAGAAATTAQGRADIMQQMAQNLLNSLFSGHSVSTVTPNSGSNSSSSRSSNPNQIVDDSTRRQQQQQQQHLLESFSLQEQYTAMQRYEQASATAGREQQNESGFGDAGNYYNDGNIGGGGFTIIDDDENPELRGRNDFPSLSSTATTTNGGGVVDRSSFYSASHIAGHQGSNGPSMTTGGAFPSLQSAASANNASSSASPENASININNSNNNNINLNGKSSSKAKKSKTLSKISGIVKKTTSEEKEKQWNAREAARRKALMSNLTFGSIPSAVGPSHTLLTPPTHGSIPSATDEQLERNRAFAEALGVKPATQRQNYASGWARPTTEGDDGVNDELLHELDAALYPDTIVAQARDRIPLLLKLEKKWMRFLNDDKAASLPLNNMDKPSRKFVHQYAEFWNLKTESFDPEPKRYIHCVKLLNTRMPRPLLSDAARHWRGPTYLPDATRTLYDSLALPDATRTMCDHTSQQTAGQTSKSRELPPPPNRVPLSLKNRSISPTAAASSELPYRAVTSMSSSKGVAIPGGTVQNSRLDALIDKERPQLDLLPRSVPLELPPLEQQTTAAYDAEEDLRKRQARTEERRLKQRKIEEKKKQVLEEAFASDDEDDVKARISDCDSEWGDEQEALYVESDEE